MPGSAKDVKVHVYIDRVRPLKFRVISKSPELPQKPAKPTKPNGDLIFANDHHPGFRVHFILQSPHHGFYFPKNKDVKKAVWSKLGEGACPDEEAWEVFCPLSVSPDGKKLTVKNDNVDPILGDFGYTLRVTNGEEWLELDPGGTNTNGPSRLSLASYATIGVGVLAFVAYSAYAFDLFGPPGLTVTESYAAISVATIAFAAFVAYAFGLLGR